MHDLMNHINPRVAIAPAAATTDNTAWVSNIVDKQGFDSVTLVIVTGALADADATFAVTLTEGDQSNLSDGAAVASQDILGGLTNASFDFSADNKCLKLGYTGGKRYLKATITPSANSGNAFVAAVWIMGHAAQQPTANPPN